jgi:hypothetical protein
MIGDLETAQIYSAYPDSTYLPLALGLLSSGLRLQLIATTRLLRRTRVSDCADYPGYECMTKLRGTNIRYTIDNAMISSDICITSGIYSRIEFRACTNVACESCNAALLEIFGRDIEHVLHTQISIDLDGNKSRGQGDHRNLIFSFARYRGITMINPIHQASRIMDQFADCFHHA